MELNKNWIWCFIFLSGCSHISGFSHKGSYEEGYRQGIHEQVKNVAAEFHGGDFPFYHWISPIVQEVQVPAHLTNGAMIPAHAELVIIQPGQWSMNASYPIQAPLQKRTDYEERTVSYTHRDASNITALP